ncbi:MAG TPA: MauE/DoxX family redox-associated membrane protein [Jiangellaceae bacterium]
MDVRPGGTDPGDRRPDVGRPDARVRPQRRLSANEAAGIVALACRLLLAGVWLYAGVSKVGDLDASIRAVKAYQLLPSTVAELVGAALPLFEIMLGLLLLAGMATRLAAAVSALLLVAFVVGIVSAWARGLRIDCGCFGGGGELAADESPEYWLELSRDLVFLAATAVLLRWPRTRWSLDGWLSART